MRLLNQMLNLSRIFDLADSTKSYQLNLKPSNLVDSDVQSQNSYLSN